MWQVTIDGFKRAEFPHYSDALDFLTSLPGRESMTARIVLAASGQRRKLSYRLAAKTKARRKYAEM